MDNYKLQRDLMDNHIRVFNNVLQKETCENLINKFESLKDEQHSWPENKPLFTQINFSKSDNWTNESHILLNLFTEIVINEIYIIYLLKVIFTYLEFINDLKK